MNTYISSTPMYYYQNQPVNVYQPHPQQVGNVNEQQQNTHVVPIVYQNQSVNSQPFLYEQQQNTQVIPVNQNVYTYPLPSPQQEVQQMNNVNEQQNTTCACAHHLPSQTIQAEQQNTPYDAYTYPNVYPYQPQVQYINSQPYVCYNHLPEILFPIYSEPVQQNDRFVSEITASAGNVAQQKIQDIENNVQKIVEQQVNEKINTCCFGMFRV